MSLRDKLGEYVPLLARKPALPREKSLALKPIRNPSVQWARKVSEEDEVNEGRLSLSVPLKRNGMARVLTKLFSMPLSKTIELDEFGGELWEMCDGQHTVEQFVLHTSSKYRLNRRQAEVSVLAFMRMLLERRLIGFYAADLDRKGEEHVSTGTVGRKRRPEQRTTGRARRRH